MNEPGRNAKVDAVVVAVSCEAMDPEKYIGKRQLIATDPRAKRPVPTGSTPWKTEWKSPGPPSKMRKHALPRSSKEERKNHVSTQHERPCSRPEKSLTRVAASTRQAKRDGFES